MHEGHSGDRAEERSHEAVGRRGLLAWAAALAGAGLAWIAGEGRAEATHAATGTPGADSLALHVDSVNPGTERTFLVTDINGNPPAVFFNGATNSAFSIGQGDGFQGITRKVNSAGVHGRGQATGGLTVGIFGDTTTTGTGIVGSSGITFLSTTPAGVGVYGQSLAESGVGVRGQIPSAVSTANTIALYGENFSSNAGAGPGAGGFGAYGFSAMGHGLVGATGTAGGGAVVGSTNGVAGAYAGIFYGQLVVVGAKNAAVPHPDGSHRLLYCMESPESWFEDFGNAKLSSGCATVAIDPEFATVADMSDYHVFVTPYGNTKGLHIAQRTPTGFTVEEHDAGTSDIAFAWRLVAKRKDVDAPRLAKVTLPAEPPHPTRPEPITDSAPQNIPAPRKPKKFEDKHTHK
jgi:hypothetical protein